MNQRQDRWDDVGAAIVDRRRALRMTQVALSRASGVSDLTLRRLERGMAADYRDDVQGAVEQALGWAPGSIRHILNGRQPTIIEPEPALGLAERVSAIEAQLVTLRALMDELLKQTGVR